ncbi:MAG: hypothetical protein LBD37_02085 [Treponema sp.]|jgi:hypothetical protein|nr:hypothetical protein [Treponema sp.]
MKKHLFFALPLAAGMVLAGCGSAPKTQGEAKPVSETSKSPAAPKRSINYEITDWQGASLGREIPVWVGDATDRNKTALVTKIAELKDKEVYIHRDEAGDLDLIRANTQINAFAQISTQIKAAISTGAGNVLSGNKGGSTDTAAKTQFVETTAAVVSKNVVSGFTLDRDFWQKRKYFDGKETVEYLAVFAIRAEDLKHQMDLALGKIEAKTAAEREAKEAIRSAIRDAKTLLVEVTDQ